MRLRVSPVVLVACVLAACAATYSAPSEPAQNASADVTSTRAQILIAARRSLVDAGYQITSSDDASGVISTAPRDLRITPAQADCGTTMGLDYLLDNRTDTQVSFGIIADDNHIDVRANVRAAYKPGAVDQNITLTCVSRGSLESDMITKIKERL